MILNVNKTDESYVLEIIDESSDRKEKSASITLLMLGQFMCLKSFQKAKLKNFREIKVG